MGQAQSGSGYSHQQQHYSVPYSTQIYPSISLGTQIHVYGVPTNDRFEINLTNNRGDVVLHVNPRVSENTLVLNAAPGGNWGNEERRPVTLPRGHPFTIIVMVTQQGFKVAVNNQHTADFAHRLPYNAADQVQVKGDVQLTHVQVYPGMSGAHGQAWQFQKEMPVPINMFPGRVVILSGQVSNQASRFEFNFLTGTHHGADVAFHFNPRFDTHAVIRNACQGGSWGNEETSGGFPLHPGQHFEIQIICFQQHYQVNVNGQPWFTFQHRIPFQTVQALQVKGDVNISNVSVL